MILYLIRSIPYLLICPLVFGQNLYWACENWGRSDICRFSFASIYFLGLIWLNWEDLKISFFCQYVIRLRDYVIFHFSGDQLKFFVAFAAILILQWRNFQCLLIFEACQNRFWWFAFSLKLGFLYLGLRRTCKWSFPSVCHFSILIRFWPGLTSGFPWSSELDCSKYCRRPLWGFVGRGYSWGTWRTCR